MILAILIIGLVLAAAPGANCDLNREHERKMRMADLHIRIGLQIDYTVDDPSYTRMVHKMSSDKVAELARNYLRCAEKKSSCVGVKHFPNLGILGGMDPHETVDRNKHMNTMTVTDEELKPIKQSIQAGACAIMTSHIPFIGPSGENRICTLNAECSAYLREELNFEGLIISDELRVMRPPLYEMWDMKYRPKKKEEQQNWDRMLWNLDEKRRVSSRTEWSSWKKWINWETLKRRNFIMNSIMKKECPSADCPEREKELLEEIRDENASMRVIEALKAGNDMVIVYPSPGNHKKIINGLVQNLKKAIFDKELSVETVNESVHRILERKHIIFQDRLFENQPMNLREKSIDALMENMSLESKIRQMLIIGGSSPGETPVAYQLEVGGVFFFRFKANRKDQKIQWKAKIPLLRITDAAGLTR